MQELRLGIGVIVRRSDRFCFALLLLLVPTGCQNQELQNAMNDALSSDERNAGVSFEARYKEYFDKGTVVIDLMEIDGSKAPADFLRILLQFADRMQHQTFQSVELARRGETRFVMAGDYFQKLGQEYGTQNPVYTMRTLPENLLRPSGEEAFPRWTGGALGVLSKQTEDFSSFVSEWVASPG